MLRPKGVALTALAFGIAEVDIFKGVGSGDEPAAPIGIFATAGLPFGGTGEAFNLVKPLVSDDWLIAPVQFATTPDARHCVHAASPRIAAQAARDRSRLAPRRDRQSLKTASRSA